MDALSVLNDCLENQIDTAEESGNRLWKAARVMAYGKLVSTWQQATKSKGFLDAAKTQDLTPFLKNMDGDACTKFMNDYLQMLAEIKPVMEAVRTSETSSR